MRIKVFYFFVRNLSRVTLNSAGLLLTQESKQASFLIVSKSPYSFLSLYQRPTFYSLHFQCCEILPRLLLMWSFLPISLSLGHLHPFATLSSFMLISWPLLIASGCTYKMYQMTAMSVFPKLAISSITLLIFDLNFTSSTITFHFSVALLSVLANSLFWSASFVKCHLSLLWEIRRQDNHMPFCLCMNWILNNRY